MSHQSRSHRAVLPILGVSVSAMVALLACSSQRSEADGNPDTVQADVGVVAGTREPRADTAHVLIDIKGMYCASCEETIQAMLMRTAGVRRVEVSAKNSRAAVTYDRTKTSPAAIVAVVTRLGYDARVHRDESGHEGRDVSDSVPRLWPHDSTIARRTK